MGQTTISQSASFAHPASDRARSVRGALAGLSLSLLLSSLGTSSANVALPTLAHAFGASFQQVQWVVLAYLLAISSLLITVGRLGDLIGRRRLLLLGIAVFTAASVLCGVAPSLWMLIAARAAQGIGASVMMALTVAMVGEAVSKEHTGSAMGMLGTMSAIGTALGPSLGGLLIAGWGWRAIFFLNLPLGGIAFLFAYRWLPVDRPRPTSGRFDHLGTGLLALTLAAYALAVTVGRGQFGVLNAALISTAGVGAVLFLLVESRAAAPLIRLSLFRSPVLSRSLAMGLLVSIVMMAALVVGPFYLSRTLGLDAAWVGIAMSAGPLVAALTGVPAGRSVDRYGARRMTLIGLCGVAVGATLLSTLPSGFGLPGYLVPTILTTASYALFQAANNTAVMANVPADQRGLVSGMLNLSRNLGLITGASAMGAVFAFAAATSDLSHASPEAAAGGMRVTFAVGAGLSVLALLVASGARSTRA